MWQNLRILELSAFMHGAFVFLHCMAELQHAMAYCWHKNCFKLLGSYFEYLQGCWVTFMTQLLAFRLFKILESVMLV